MKQKIQNILDKQKELSNCNNMIFEKENDILSCIKAIGEEGVRMRQKQAAISLLELKEKKKSLGKELTELCKGFDLNSFKNKKLSSQIVSECISSGIMSKELRELKEVYKSLNDMEV